MGSQAPMSMVVSGYSVMELSGLLTG